MDHYQMGQPQIIGGIFIRYKMFTIKQQKDLETVKYFIPKILKDVVITEEDEKNFLKFSEQGIEPEYEVQIPILERYKSGYYALREGKKYRGLHMRLWEEGILEGTNAYWTLLGREDESEKPPRVVVDFMKREMFHGMDAEKIEKIYQGGGIENDTLFLATLMPSFMQLHNI